MISNAITYINNKFSVFPLNGKRPFFEWGAYQSKIASEEQVKLWWGIHRGSNIGIATGQISELFIIDIDRESERNLPLVREIVDRHTKDYFVSKTGKGYHLWFHCLDAVNTTNTIVARSQDRKVYVETRGHGGYIVAPPSIHPELKTKYKFIEGSVIKFHKLKNIDSFLIKAILSDIHCSLNEYEEKPPSPTEQKIRDGKLVVCDLKSYLGKIFRNEIRKVEFAGNGERNRALFMAAANLGQYSLYVEQNQIIEALLKASNTNGYISDDGRGHAVKTIQSGLKRSSIIEIEEDPFLEIFS